MSELHDSHLHNSPLHERHAELGATFTPFGPWNMPLKYGNELDEHRAVRTAAGLFDLSHMGEIRITGEQSAEYLDHAFISTLSTMPVHRAKYTMLVDDEGGILDDLLIYRLAETEFLAVPNAGNTDVVWAALRARSKGWSVELKNESAHTVLLALQGPKAQEILLTLVSEQHKHLVEEMRYYTCAVVEVYGRKMLCARTGYTGEDGFELYTDPVQGRATWDALLECGTGGGLVPAGLAARDSLRLEAGLPLYGKELDLDITPVEAGMGAAFAKKEADFVGRSALVGREPTSRIVGLKGLKRAARTGAEVWLGDELVGHVTSGQPSPTLGYPVALARLRPDVTAEGTALEVDIRGKRHPFEIVAAPFYKRAGK